MEVEPSSGGAADDDDDLMSDPAFLQNVLQNLPGVDPSTVDALRNQDKDKKPGQGGNKKPEPK